MAATEDPKVSESRRMARLLLKSIDSLPEKDRKKLLEYLLSVVFHNAPGGLFAPYGAGVTLSPALRRTAPQMEQFVDAALRARKSGASQRTLEGEQQMVPMRFPKEQYESFKSWCEENGFSMAVVVRGLVERFLEEQGRRAS